MRFDSLTDAVVNILCRYGRGGEIPLLEPFLRYNELVRRGEMLCTHWCTVFDSDRDPRLVQFIGGVCCSIIYVLKHLEAEGLIRIRREDGWIEINPKLCTEVA